MVTASDRLANEKSLNLSYRLVVKNVFTFYFLFILVVTVSICSCVSWFTTRTRGLLMNCNRCIRFSGISTTDMLAAEGAAKSLARHESLAAKIGSASMANLGVSTKSEDVRDSSVNSIKSKSLANLGPRS